MFYQLSTIKLISYILSQFSEESTLKSILFLIRQSKLMN